MTSNEACFSCGATASYELVEREPERVVRHSIAFEVSGLKWYECKVCHEVMSTPSIVNENAHLIDRAYAERRNQHRVEKNLLTPSTIKSIRLALGESQEALSDLLGVGPNGLQKYESDKSCPSKPAELILRVLALYPTFLSRLKEIAFMPATSFGQVHAAIGGGATISSNRGRLLDHSPWTSKYKNQISAGAICGAAFVSVPDKVYAGVLIYPLTTKNFAITDRGSEVEVEGLMQIDAPDFWSSTKDDTLFNVTVIPAEKQEYAY